MNNERILEIAYETVRLTWINDSPEDLIAFAKAIIEAERDNIEAPIVKVPIEIFAKLRKQKVCVSDLVEAIKQVEAEREARKLTDEEIGEIVREASNGSTLRRDGSTSLRIARAIERRINGEEE